MQFIKKNASIILFFILGTSFALSIGAMKDDTATFDERAHIPAAYSYVRYGDMRLNPEHPPLLKDLAGLPLLFLQPSFPIESDLWTNGITKQWQNGTAMWSTWDIGTAFLYKSGNDAELMIFLLRLPMVLLSILLGYFVYRFTKEIAGTVAGLFATLLYAFDPNVLAHNHYVTTDLGIAAFIFIATYYFVHFLKNPSPKHIALAGIALGLAQLAKFSALILIPLFGLIVIVSAFTRTPFTSLETHSKTSRFKTIWTLLFQYIIILTIAFGIIWIGYLANTWNMPAEKTILHANLVFAGDAAPKTFARNTIVTLANTHGFEPIAHYMLGVFMVFSRITGGNTLYFIDNIIEPSLGESARSYFPLVFILKETIPFLFLFFLTGIYALCRLAKAFATKKMSSYSFEEHIPQYVMLSFVLFYIYLSISGNLNIGLRHIFPILPFFYVLVTITLFSFIKKRCSLATHFYCPTKHLYHIILGIFAFWIVIIPFLAYPNYLSYFNESIGGTKNGHHYVVDSNYDWGQNLKRLKTWIDDYNQCLTNQTPLSASSCHALTEGKPFPTTEPITNPHIDYYGGSEVSYYFPEGTYTAWHANNAPQAGWFAISATFFEENIHKPLKPGETDYKWLLKYQPVGSAGTSMLIYYISPESLQ